ncbi:PREDICTED: protein unc-45 homolog A [Tarenaya hassleriana]|uniref:protein unc-45 homolog A n=1 Tax=Tarenaya hassleriana TaxID=28532 RepID=UPI00053C76FA|nr:PREDICTED: protein unc-45 homolog A [Tarenaya hassleriana]
MASASPASKVEKGHQLYRDGRYSEALVFYTEALAAAKAKPQKIALHSNRAACYLKLHDFKQAAVECTSVLELDQKHSGALMLRAQTLVTLKEYHSALFDVNRLIELNPDSEVYLNLEARLRTQLSLAPIPESEAELEEDDEEIGTAVSEKERDEEKGSGKYKSALYQRKDKTFDSIVSFKRDERTGETQTEVASPKTPEIRESTERITAAVTGKVVPKEQNDKGTASQESKGWQAIPKPKGHSTLDYARWDRVEDDSSEDDDDDDEEEEEECRPQYRFRLRTAGVRPVK